MLCWVGQDFPWLEADNPQKALAANEVLLFKLSADLPPAIQAASPDRKERVCVFDTVSKTTRLLAHLE
jgi:hypothetical protein